MSIFTNNMSSAKDEAAQYTAALLGLVGDRDPIEVLRTAPDVVANIVKDIDIDRLRKPEAPGKWSALQVLAHLADSEVVFGWRLRHILGDDDAKITGYDQDKWADRLHYQNVDPSDALDTYRVLRRWNLFLLENANAAELARYGVHSERGNESIAHLIRLYAGHDTAHLNQIKRILK